MLKFVPSDILRQICTNLPIEALALLFGTLDKRLQHTLLLPGVIERLDIDKWSFDIATFVYSLQNLTNVRIGKIVANHFIEHLMNNPIEKIEINHTLVLGYDDMIEDLDEEEKRGFHFPSIPLVAWTQNAFIPNFGSMFPRLRQLFLNHAIDKLVDNVRGGPFHGLDDMQEHYECALERDDPSYASESSLSSVPEDYIENISSSSSWSDIYHHMDALDASREAAIANLFATVPRQLELLHINLPPENVSPMIYFAQETLLLLPTPSITSLELNFGSSTWCNWHRNPQPLNLRTLGAEFPSMVHFKMGLMVSTDEMITDPKLKTFGIPPAPYEVFERPEWTDSDITDYRFTSPISKNPLKSNQTGTVPMEVDPKLPSLESLHFILTTLGCLYLTSFELPPHLQRLTIEAFPIAFSMSAVAPHTIHLSKIIEQSNLSGPVDPPPSFCFPHTLTELSLISVTLGIDYFRLLPSSLVKLAITDDDAQPETGLGVVLASEPTRLPNLQSLRIVGSSKNLGVFKPQVSLAFIPSTVTELDVGSSMSGSLLKFDSKDFHSLQRLCTHETQASNLFELFKCVPETCTVVSKSTLRITKDEWLELMTSSDRSLPTCVCPETVILAIDQHFGRRLTATFHLHVPAPDRRHPMQESHQIVSNHEADSVSFCRDSVNSNGRIHLDWNRLSPMFFNSLGNLNSMVIEAEGALHELTSRPIPKFAPFTCKTLTNLCLNVPLPAVLPLSNFPPLLTTLRLYGSHRFGTLMELHTITSLTCLDVPFCTIRPFEKIHMDLPQLVLLSCTLDFNTDEEMASVLSGLASLEESRLRGYGCFTSELIPMNSLSNGDHCEEDSVALIPESMLPWISALEEVAWIHLDEGMARRLALLGDPSFKHFSRDDDAD